jgi:hypothetical protein
MNIVCLVSVNDDRIGRMLRAWQRTSTQHRGFGNVDSLSHSTGEVADFGTNGGLLSECMFF